jgi:hypothetical protein
MTTTEYEVCKADENYEIRIVDEGVYEIKKVSNGKVVSFHMRNGYLRVTLSGKNIDLHRLVALQWIQKDHPNKTWVDHINRDISDNRLSNLRWVTPSGNSYNRSVVEYKTEDEVNAMFDRLIEIDSYNDHKFMMLFYDTVEDCFLQEMEYRSFKVKRWCLNDNRKSCRLIDQDRRFTCIYQIKFMRNLREAGFLNDEEDE